MNRILTMIFITLILAGCGSNKSPKLSALAKAGDAYLFTNQIPAIISTGTSDADSVAIVQNYINSWAKRELLFQKAEENLSPELKEGIENQLDEARANLVIYQYQRQMILERMDTTITEEELALYYSTNQQSFKLSTSIVKALFIKLPAETPNISRIRLLARSSQQADLQQLETLCYQFADKFDDFGEQWVSLNRITVELPTEIENEDGFLRRTTFYETNDSTFIYMVAISDFRLRSALSPYEFVKDDIRRIIWNARRLKFIQALENGIYNDAIKEDRFTIFNN